MRSPTPPRDLPDDADEPEDIQVARRVVVEEVAVVKPDGPLVARSHRPEPEGAEVDLEPGPGSRYAMMRRRARPSARTTRTAPTAPCIPVSRDAPECLARSRQMRGQSPGTAPARAWKVDLSVAQGRPRTPRRTSGGTGCGVVPGPWPGPGWRRAARRPGRIRGGLDGAAAGCRVLGHGRAPGGRPAARDRPSDGIPHVRPSRLAGLGGAPAVRRAGLPDEPVVGALRSRRGRRHGRPRSRL